MTLLFSRGWNSVSLTLMSFLEIYIQGFGYVMILMTLVWIASVFMKNASIVDPFWSVGFIVAGISYYFNTEGISPRRIILMTLLIIWGLRLAIYLGWRNIGKPEDCRYQQFRTSDRYDGSENRHGGYSNQ